jgi:GTPase
LVNLPQRRHHATKQRTKPFEFLIEDIYHQVPGVGTVISGFVSRGEWNKGEALYIGPLKDGTIFKATPKSTHVAQSFVDRVWAGHSVCFAIPKPPKGRRLLLSKKGMVAMKELFQFSNEFVADIYLTKGQTVTIQKNRFAPTIQLLHNKVTGKVVNIVIRDTIHGGGLSKEAETIRQGDRATVTFQVHKHRPAFVRPGMRVILREGHVLGYGIVLSSETV